MIYIMENESIKTKSTVYSLVNHRNDAISNETLKFCGVILVIYNVADNGNSSRTSCSVVFGLQLTRRHKRKGQWL